MSDYSRLEKTVFQRDRLRELKVLVVGAGALGNEVVKALGLLGVGGVTVTDPDSVEASNLTRSVFWRGHDVVGRNKALALVEAAGKLFPDTLMTGIGREIADVGFQEIAPADIILSCVDSDLARLEIAYVSTKLDLPVADAGLGRHNYSHGRVTYFPGRSAACYGCRLTQARRRELLTLWESEVHSCWANADASTGQNYPSTPTMAAVVGSMQVEIGLRNLLEAREKGGTIAASVEIFLDPALRLETFRVMLDKTCPFHGSDGVLVRPLKSSATTVDELLDAAEGGNHGAAVLVLDWPICSDARCTDCGFSWSPMKRLASLRRRGRCPSCGSRVITEQQTIRSIGRASQWARLSLAELGLPEQHLHTIRLSTGQR